MYIRRKVFSYSEPEEQLYSVTMNEEELDLFSEFMDGYYEALYSSDDVDAAAAAGAIGAATALTGAAGIGYGMYKNGADLEAAKEFLRKRKAAGASVKEVAGQIAAAKANGATDAQLGILKDRLKNAKENRKIARKANRKAAWENVKNAYKAAPKWAKIAGGVGAAGAGAAGLYAYGRNRKN